jgi:hypothetical protein
MKKVRIGGMSEANYGLKTLKKIHEEQLGDYTVLFVGPWDIEKLKAVIPFCKKNGMRFVMDEAYSRLRGVFREPFDSYDKQKFQNLLKSAGDAFDGTLFMCEYGGMMLYWPENYVSSSPNTIPATHCAQTAKDFMISQMQKMLQDTTDKLLLPPMICIEASGGVAKYHYEAGYDRVDLEMTYDRLTEFYYSATKGATIAYDKKRFGVDLAMVWYGGNHHDELWFKRWKTSLYHAFIRGADPIYAEHGLMDYKALGKDLDTDAPEVKRFRAELAGLERFAKNNLRPNGFPLAKMAFVYGNLDSMAMGQPYVWGQRGGKDGIPSGTAEHSWDIFNSIYQKRSWEFRYRFGDRDLSGNPPLGQADVIPIEASIDKLQQYDCLIFLGWNTMTKEQYDKLKLYVKNGGDILCTLGHLDTRTNRDNPIALINNGDLTELFGLKVTLGDKKCRFGIKFKQNPKNSNYQFPLWSAVSDPKYGDGEFPLADVKLISAEITANASGNFADTWEQMDKKPVITTNRLGKGRAFLLHTPEYPGHHGLRRLYTDLITFFAAAHQDKNLQVETADAVRYAVYEEADQRTVYLLNTDTALTHEAIIYDKEQVKKITLKPIEITIYTCSN